MPAASHDAYFGAPIGVIVPAGATPTGIRLATLRDLGIKLSQEFADLEGEDDVTIDKGVKSRKCTISAKTAEWRLDALIAFHGGVLTTGRLITVKDEAATIPATPFQVTVANTTGFVDFTVRDLTNGGKFMTRVASGPTAGQYSVTTGGQYTFAAADTAHQVLISYSYTSATGSTATMSARPSAIAAKAALYVGRNDGSNKDFAFQFPAIVVPSMGWSFKNRDWGDHDVEIEALADANKKFFYTYQG